MKSDFDSCNASQPDRVGHGFQAIARPGSSGLAAAGFSAYSRIVGKLSGCRRQGLYRNSLLERWALALARRASISASLAAMAWRLS